MHSSSSSLSFRWSLITLHTLAISRGLFTVPKSSLYFHTLTFCSWCFYSLGLTPALLLLSSSYQFVSSLTAASCVKALALPSPNPRLGAHALHLVLTGVCPCPYYITIRLFLLYCKLKSRGIIHMENHQYLPDRGCYINDNSSRRNRLVFAHLQLSCSSPEA